MSPTGSPARLGIVGGVGPESTIDYYRAAIAHWRMIRPDGTFPEIVIASVDGGTVIRQLGEPDFDAVGRAFGAALEALTAAGCRLALIASNAGHLAFERIAPPTTLPMVHIVETARDAALAAGHRRLGIIGTRFVVRSDLYPKVFGPAGIEIVLPTDAEQTVVHDIYLGELVEGVILDSSRERIIEVIATMRDRDGIDGLILGGTELALTLTGPTYAGVPILDTVRIQIRAAVDRLAALN